MKVTFACQKRTDERFGIAIYQLVERCRCVCVWAKLSKVSKAKLFTSTYFDKSPVFTWRDKSKKRAKIVAFFRVFVLTLVAWQRQSQNKWRHNNKARLSRHSLDALASKEAGYRSKLFWTQGHEENAFENYFIEPLELRKCKHQKTMQQYLMLVTLLRFHVLAWCSS